MTGLNVLSLVHGDLMSKFSRAAASGGFTEQDGNERVAKERVLHAAMLVVADTIDALYTKRMSTRGRGR